MEKSTRLFTGIALPEQIRNELSDRLPEWRRKLAFERWPHPDDWHVTLHFLGETSSDKVPGVETALDEAARSTPPFELTLEGFGVFGAPRSPSILWAGLAGPLGPLLKLHAALSDSLLREIGFEAEKRPYRPHLTIARKYKGSDRWDAALLEDGFSPLSFTVHEAVLFRSRLGRSPMYEIIRHSPLG